MSISSPEGDTIPQGEVPPEVIEEIRMAPDPVVAAAAWALSRHRRDYGIISGTKDLETFTDSGFVTDRPFGSHESPPRVYR